MIAINVSKVTPSASGQLSSLYTNSSCTTDRHRLHLKLKIHYFRLISFAIREVYYKVFYKYDEGRHATELEHFQHHGALSLTS